nr:uncharacterized protein LOC111429574 [Onthophagus taurus]
MAKTSGYYLLEKSFSKDYAWPTSHGLRRYGIIILIVVNAIWIFYPLIIEVKDYKTNFAKLLFKWEFIVPGTAILLDNILILRNPRGLIEMIDLLSDFNRFGIPERMKFIEENMKTIVKTIHYIACFVGYVISYYTMLENDCTNVMNTKICFIMEYFIPYKAKQYEITLIMLFQIYGIAVTVNVMFCSLLLYGHSFELLTVRIEHLKSMIDNIHLTKNRKRNLKILRRIALYHQDIFRLFKYVNSFFLRFLVSTKTCILVSVTISITQIVLKKNLISCWMFISNFLALFFIHTVGQRFTTAASSVADSVYNLNWFDSDVSTRKDCVILLCMSQHPLTSELPLFGQMSHTSVAKEYKVAYVFYNWIATTLKQKIV